MAARGGAGTPDGDAQLADAVAARDAALAAWEAGAGGRLSRRRVTAIA